VEVHEPFERLHPHSAQSVLTSDFATKCFSLKHPPDESDGFGLTELVIVDPPYGVMDPKECPWDVAWGEEMFRTLFHSVGVFSDTSDATMFVYCEHDQAAKIEEAGMATGWQHSCRFFWCKPNAGNSGGKRITQAVESLVMLQHNRETAIWNYDTASITRHNFVSCDTETSLLTNENNVAVNKTQKPVALEKDNFVVKHSRPGQWVLSICAGTFTSAIAALSAGRNCVVIEKDPIQWQHGVARVQSWIVQQLSAKAKEAQATQSKTKEKKKRGNDDEKEDEEENKEGTASDAPPSIKCFKCKEAVDVNSPEVKTCPAPKCVTAFHVACTTFEADHKDGAVKVCSGMCKTALEKVHEDAGELSASY